ncbi:MAG: HTH-type transcriptional activator IlvY [Gammaproteobacteria bacterium]|nr:HTH-type transcriptional activator IlvY [Gammaproteobacteria bacterium]
MNLRQLEQFTALAQTLHFGRAASKANVSISALSRTIAQLEQAAGTDLFERNNRSVTLTSAGKHFQQFSHETLQNWRDLQAKLHGQALLGEINVYCSVTASYSILDKILSRFRQSHPRVDINLHTGNAEHAIERVQSGEDDITIAAKPDTLPKGLAFKSLKISPLLFIAPKQSIIELPSSVEDWEQTPMIVAESGLSRIRLDKWFARQNIKPRYYAQVSGNEAIVSMVGLGLGIGVVPDLVLNHSPMIGQTTVLESLCDALEPYDVGLVTRENRLQNSLISAFWQSVDG